MQKKKLEIKKMAKIGREPNQAQQNVEIHNRLKARVHADKVFNFRNAWGLAHTIGGHDMLWTWRHAVAGELIGDWKILSKYSEEDKIVPNSELKKKFAIGAIGFDEIFLVHPSLEIDFSQAAMFRKVVREPEKITLDLDLK
jgi:hypothetical protein